MAERALRIFVVTAYVLFNGWAYIAMTVGWAGAPSLLKDYQSIIAAIVALVPIIYIAEQLRLQRRQHAVSARLALKDEHRALDMVEGYEALAEVITVEVDGQIAMWGPVSEPTEESRRFVRDHTMPYLADAFDVMSVTYARYNVELALQEARGTLFEEEGRTAMQQKARWVKITRDKVRQIARTDRERLERFET